MKGSEREQNLRKTKNISHIGETPPSGASREQDCCFLTGSVTVPDGVIGFE